MLPMAWAAILIRGLCSTLMTLALEDTQACRCIQQPGNTRAQHQKHACVSTLSAEGCLITYMHCFSLR